MRKNHAWMPFFIVMIGLSLVFAAGCAKKVAVKEEAMMEKQAAVEKQAAPEAKPPEAKKEKDEAAAAAAAAAALAAKQASEFVDIHFAFDRYDLRPDARAILQAHADWLAAHPDYAVKIEGHCDERGTNEYNLALGEKRARSAMDYLANLGVVKSRIATISYGEERPLDPRHNREAWRKNRRAHFDVTIKK